MKKGQLFYDRYNQEFLDSKQKRGDHDEIERGFRAVLDFEEAHPDLFHYKSTTQGMFPKITKKNIGCLQMSLLIIKTI